eukprot:TRINITY_DN6776_c0_g1_i1.p1 TRINITY_DN6776_c0_g1~~TRINITY_DN6776_c0_g1_i1.p1  ORF type:complete len:508 (+),score=65.93 TRINITY_DN6776_c0_g1_i1:33-1556(+)
MSNKDSIVGAEKRPSKDVFLKKSITSRVCGKINEYEIPTPTGFITGYLTKQGKNLKNWKRRWCSLGWENLFYYNRRMVCVGCINITAYTRIELRRNHIVIHYDHRIWDLRPIRSQSQRDVVAANWYNALCIFHHLNNLENPDLVIKMRDLSLALLNLLELVENHNMHAIRLELCDSIMLAYNNIVQDVHKGLLSLYPTRAILEELHANSPDYYFTEIVTNCITSLAALVSKDVASIDCVTVLNIEVPTGQSDLELSIYRLIEMNDLINAQLYKLCEIIGDDDDDFQDCHLQFNVLQQEYNLFYNELLQELNTDQLIGYLHSLLFRYENDCIAVTSYLFDDTTENSKEIIENLLETINTSGLLIKNTLLDFKNLMLYDKNMTNFLVNVEKIRENIIVLDDENIYAVYNLLTVIADHFKGNCDSDILNEVVEEIEVRNEVSGPNNPYLFMCQLLMNIVQIIGKNNQDTITPFSDILPDLMNIFLDLESRVIRRSDLSSDLTISSTSDDD